MGNFSAEISNSFRSLLWRNEIITILFLTAIINVTSNLIADITSNLIADIISKMKNPSHISKYSEMLQALKSTGYIHVIDKACQYQTDPTIF